MITSVDLLPDKEFTDSDGDVRRIIRVENGKVHYHFLPKGEAIPESYNTILLYVFLQFINGRNAELINNE